MKLTGFRRWKQAALQDRQHEGERQLVLLALALLSIDSPGFDYACNEIALQFDNVDEVQTAEGVEKRARMYDEFRRIRATDQQIGIGTKEES